MPPRTCEICRSTRFYMTDFGYYVCQNGHQQHQFDIRQDEFANTTLGKRIRQSLKSQRSQVAKEEEDSEKEKESEEEKLKKKIKIYQWILRKQILWLIQEKEFPADFENTVKECWLVYINHYCYKNPTSDKIITLLDNLIVLYLSCLRSKLPYSPVEIWQLPKQGMIYFNSLHQAPETFKNVRQYRIPYPSAQEFIRKCSKAIFEFWDILGLGFDYGKVLDKWQIDLALPEPILNSTIGLIQKLQFKFLPPKVIITNRLWLPEILLYAFLFISLKLIYGLHNGQQYKVPENFPPLEQWFETTIKKSNSFFKNRYSDRFEVSQFMTQLESVMPPIRDSFEIRQFEEQFFSMIPSNLDPNPQLDVSLETTDLYFSDHSSSFAHEHYKSYYKQTQKSTIDSSSAIKELRLSKLHDQQYIQFGLEEDLYDIVDSDSETYEFRHSEEVTNEYRIDEMNDLLDIDFSRMLGVGCNLLACDSVLIFEWLRWLEKELDVYLFVEYQLDIVRANTTAPTASTSNANLPVKPIKRTRKNVNTKPKKK